MDRIFVAVEGLLVDAHLEKVQSTPYARHVILNGKELQSPSGQSLSESSAARLHTLTRSTGDLECHTIDGWHSLPPPKHAGGAAKWQTRQLSWKDHAEQPATVLPARLPGSVYHHWHLQVKSPCRSFAQGAIIAQNAVPGNS